MSSQTGTENQPKPRRAWFEWFWRGRALRAARAERAAQAAGVLARRARIAAEVGKQALEPSGPWSAGDASHVASALFVESMGWSLRALSVIRADPDSGSFTKPPSAEELARLLDAHETSLLDAARGPERLRRLRRYVLEREFEHTELPLHESRRLALELMSSADHLLDQIRPLYSAVERVMVQRALRMGGLASLLLVATVAAVLLSAHLERRRDLARGKPWLASSSYATVCKSPEHACGELRDYFFHTQEESNPWLEIDLTRPHSVSSVKVWNRSGCCAERAAPLVVEVSSDRQKWREVARRETPFDTWRGSFAPTTARWVRFRVARRSFLHLQDVRIFP